MRRFLAVSLILACGAVQGSPVPPSATITPAQTLLGKWEYHYGQMPVGWIEFHDTGVYLSRHSPDEEPHYCGEWWIDNAGHLNLVERMLSQYEEGGGVNPRHTRYVFALSFSPGECRGESNIPGLPTQAVTVILRR